MENKVCDENSLNDDFEKGNCNDNNQIGSLNNNETITTFRLGDELHPVNEDDEVRRIYIIIF